jgi:hypothetical protein
MTCRLSTRLRTRLDHWLAMTRQTIGVLQNLPGLSGRSLAHGLGWTLSRRLVSRVPLENCRLLWWRSMHRMARKLGVDLLLSRNRRPLWHLLRRALQNLWHKLSLHARVRSLNVGHLRLVLDRHWRSLHRRRLRGRRDCLRTHHGLHLFKAHHLPSRAWSFLHFRTPHMRRRRHRHGRGLLRLDPPDISTRLQLGNVVGVMVALVAGSGGFGSLGDGRPLLLLRRLTGLEKQLLFMDGGGDLRGLASKVKVPSD